MWSLHYFRRYAHALKIGVHSDFAHIGGHKSGLAGGTLKGYLLLKRK